MDRFEIDWTDDDGTCYETLYWVTKGRTFCKTRIGGVEKKTRRISESDYISAWERYRNY